MKNNYNQREISLSLSVCPCVCVWGGNTALPFLFFPGCLVTIQSPHSVELCVWMLLQLKSAWEPPPLPPSMQIPPSHLFLLSSPSSISPSFSSTRCSSSSSRCLFSPSRSLSSHARLSTTERLKIAPGIPASIQKKEEEEEVWGGWGSQLTQGHPPPPPTHTSVPIQHISWFAPAHISVFIHETHTVSDFISSPWIDKKKSPNGIDPSLNPIKTSLLIINFVTRRMGMSFHWALKAKKKKVK